MEPQTLDQDAVNLAKAIRQHESGGNFNIKGKSGEYGAYQFTAPTWKGYAKEVLGDENAEMTPQNQNKVAYTKIKKWKDSGKNIGQIASMWNAGEGRPNAYLENNVGTNEFGVHYDTPTYAKKVAEYYQKYKGQNPQKHISVNDAKKPEEPKKTFGEKVSNTIQTIFPGKKVGEAIGTLAGYIATPKENKQYYDLSAPKPLQVAGDIAQGALTAGVGMPAGTALSAFGKTAPTIARSASTIGRIGQTAGIGAGLGLTGALAKGEINAGNIAKETAVGGLTGGILGTAGEGIAKFSEIVPQWLARKYITGKGVGNDTIKYAINKGLGSPSKMLTESENSISSLGTQLGSVLKSPQYKDFKVPGRDILNKVAQDFPDAGLSRVDILNKLKNIVPLKANLAEKLIKGNLTLDELHTLNSSLGKNTFKSVFDGVEVKANKEIGSAVYHTISDIIKNIAPETKPLFADLSKEYPLRTALESLIKRGEQKKALNINDIMAFTSGLTAGGPMTGFGAFAARKVASSPTFNLKTAGLISKLRGATVKQTIKGTKPLIMKGVIDKFNQ